MKAAKSLRRPDNWQDFETLCKKLWGEIWNCPEIKKNGRSGQNQNGVDIFGIPKGENEYYGIQCKGKDEYTNKQISSEEISEEIEKATKFTPLLKKLYFATTAIKDVKIEEFVRIKNIEHLQKGIFEVHIFSWEDIVELIDENRQTYDWYVKSQNFKVNQSAILTFHDGSEELDISVKFLQKVTEYRQRTLLEELIKKNINDDYFNIKRLNSFIIKNPLEDNTINYSVFYFNFVIHNNGLSPIEDFKIFFELEGEFINLIRTFNWFGMFPPKETKPYNTFLYSDNLSGEINPIEKVIVSEDKIEFDTLKIKPIYDKPSTILINWRLTSRDYKNNGQLKINIKPEIIKEKKVELVEDIADVKIVLGEIEDYRK